MQCLAWVTARDDAPGGGAAPAQLALRPPSAQAAAPCTDVAHEAIGATPQLGADATIRHDARALAATVAIDSAQSPEARAALAALVAAEADSPTLAGGPAVLDAIDEAEPDQVFARSYVAEMLSATELEPEPAPKPEPGDASTPETQPELAPPEPQPETRSASGRFSSLKNAMRLSGSFRKSRASPESGAPP